MVETTQGHPQVDSSQPPRCTLSLDPFRQRHTIVKGPQGVQPQGCTPSHTPNISSKNYSTILNT